MYELIVSRLAGWPILVIAGVLVLGLIAGYALGKLGKRLLTAAGVPKAVEGTAFERTARSLGTSTVSIVARMASWFIYGVTLVVVIHVLYPLETDWVWQRLIAFLPQLFLAALVLVIGFVVADKAELVVSERLRSVKLPEVTIIPKTVKYSVLYVAFLIALGQVGVRIAALLVLLGVYVLGIVFVVSIAAKDLLSSAAAGIYLLLNQPYVIGDDVKIGDQEGIVQEMDVFVTRLEGDGQEFVVPNSKIFEHGISKRRE